MKKHCIFAAQFLPYMGVELRIILIIFERIDKKRKSSDCYY